MKEGALCMQRVHFEFLLARRLGRRSSAEPDGTLQTEDKILQDLRV